MHFHQVIAIAVMVALALVIDTTIKLFRYRRRAKIAQEPWRMRDVQILRKPEQFEPDEVKLARRHWIACVAMLAMILLFLALRPDVIPVNA